MTPQWPRAHGPPPASAVLRRCPEDFVVTEELGFEPAGEGEHVFLYLQKRQLNSMDLVQAIAALSNVAPRDIGLAGLKDRNAVARQWFSVGLAGRAEPDWRQLERDGDVRVLAATRHRRKLRRGVHRANRFALTLREVRGDRAALEQRLAHLREHGVPNYFGPQRFGRQGATLQQARQWSHSARRITRTRRGLYLSALRAFLFNTLLGERVASGQWQTVLPGDVCLLQGTRSLFTCEWPDAAVIARAQRGDIHPGLPLWGAGRSRAGSERARSQAGSLQAHRATCAFLVRQGLEMGWRAARVLADDFCWEFCDDGSLRLDFALGAGSYATALLAELVQHNEGM
ncbi:MAG: tRNA pseudouridine(13) synthase TruD [Halioglobus sp.]|nr:tRNA pseudouridine(13) synthase TruD [Halioglobus sp.]